MPEVTPLTGPQMRCFIENLYEQLKARGRQMAFHQINRRRAKIACGKLGEERVNESDVVAAWEALLDLEKVQRLRGSGKKAVYIYWEPQEGEETMASVVTKPNAMQREECVQALKLVVAETDGPIDSGEAWLKVAGLVKYRVEGKARGPIVRAAQAGEDGIVSTGEKYYPKKRLNTQRLPAQSAKAQPPEGDAIGDGETEGGTNLTLRLPRGTVLILEDVEIDGQPVGGGNLRMRFTKLTIIVASVALFLFVVLPLFI